MTQFPLKRKNPGLLVLSWLTPAGLRAAAVPERQPQAAPHWSLPTAPQGAAAVVPGATVMRCEMSVSLLAPQLGSFNKQKLAVPPPAPEWEPRIKQGVSLPHPEDDCLFQGLPSTPCQNLPTLGHSQGAVPHRKGLPCNLSASKDPDKITL